MGGTFEGSGMGFLCWGVPEWTLVVASLAVVVPVVIFTVQVYWRHPRLRFSDSVARLFPQVRERRRSIDLTDQEGVQVSWVALTIGAFNDSDRLIQVDKIECCAGPGLDARVLDASYGATVQFDVPGHMPLTVGPSNQGNSPDDQRWMVGNPMRIEPYARKMMSFSVRICPPVESDRIKLSLRFSDSAGRTYRYKLVARIWS